MINFEFKKILRSFISKPKLAGCIKLIFHAQLRWFLSPTCLLSDTLPDYHGTTFLLVSDRKFESEFKRLTFFHPCHYPFALFVSSGFPHGRLSIATLVLGLLAFFLTFWAVNTCWFYKIDGSLSPYPPTYYVSTYYETGVGLRGYEYQDINGILYCQPFDTDMVKNFLDGTMRVSRGLGTLAFSITGICAILILLTSCFEFSSSLLKGIGFCMCLSALLVLLTLVGFGSKITKSPYNGSFSVGPGMAIASSAICLYTGILVWKVQQANHQDVQTVNEMMLPETHQAGIVSADEPAGTRKIFVSTVNPDGSITVEEITERPTV